MNSRNVCVTLSEFCKDDDRPRRLLAESGFRTVENTTGRRVRPEELKSMLKDADAVIAGVELYEAALLQALPRLKCISRCGVGVDAIDLDAAKRQGIAILTTVDEVVEPVAQMTVGMVLALARNFPWHMREFQANQWKKHTGVLLSEWSIGLVGFGRIGRRVEALLRAFGCRILISDPCVAPDSLPPGTTLCDLPSLLRQADLVSLHAARPAEYGPILGRFELQSMKPGARLVNTARGHLIDQQALTDALQSGHLGAAALDVFDVEPYEGVLGTLPQVLCTPHVGTLTHASRAAMELRAVTNVLAWYSGQDAHGRYPKMLDFAHPEPSPA